jgi:hypothetical protein
LQAVPISANSGIHTIGSRKKVSAAKLGPIGADLVAHKPLHFTHQTLYPLYPPKADMCGAARDVRFGPKADMVSFDNFVGER